MPIPQPALVDPPAQQKDKDVSTMLAPAKFALALFIPAAVPLLAAAGLAWAFLPLFLAAFLIADAVLGIGDPAPERGRPTLGYRMPIWLYIPAQLALILWGAVESRSQGLGPLLVLALDIGLASGIFGMLAAHEMIHSRHLAERLLGLALLATVGYMHFRISHIYFHHRLAATAEDPATARRGESAYRFMLRSIAGQWRQARAFERRRTAGKRLPWLADRALRGALLSTGFAVALAAGLGPRALLFGVVHGIVAVLILELFNYVAHYGLSRRTLPDGRTERLGPRHSWNTRHRFTNWTLLNGGRHSDHHRQPTEPYQCLTETQAEALLPAGYTAAFCLALVPPLWRQIMDPRAVQADLS